MDGSGATQRRNASDSHRPLLAFGYNGQGNVSAVGQYDATGTSLERQVCLRHDALGRLVLVGTTSTTFTPGATARVSDAEVMTCPPKTEPVEV